MPRPSLFAPRAPDTPTHGGLATDLYELRMAASYLGRDMTTDATFSFFVRHLPQDWGFLVVDGLGSCVDALLAYGLDPSELAFLSEIGFRPEAVDALAGLRFTGDVHAVPEGRIVLPGEPILEVTAPLPEAQVVETLVLNHLTHQIALATKATRCRVAAAGAIGLADFSMRRTHGMGAAMSVARACALAGFDATSNVEAARRHGLRAAGTMAHSFVEAFATEREAFEAFIADHGPSTLLVDTYSTDEGVRLAIEVIGRRSATGTGFGIRIDSGDLVEGARAARRRLDEAGLTDVRIVVSGGVDEHALERFRRTGAPIDLAGIGAQLGVAADAPVLDSAYKLVRHGTRDVMKLSPGKATLPGPKQVHRRRGAMADVIARRDEPIPPGHDALLAPVVQHGRLVRPDATDLTEARHRLDADLAALPPAALAAVGPDAPEAAISTPLSVLAEQVRAAIRERVSG